MSHFEFDIHTHTIASGHGSAATITDMVKTARTQHLNMLGISDHGPATLGGGKPAYFRNLTYAPKNRMGIRMLYGAEVSILDNHGKLDLEDEILKHLDNVIASLHRPAKRPGSKEENTRSYIEAMKKPYVRIIGHCDDVKFPVDYLALVEAAMEYHVILELNDSSLRPDGYRGDTRFNDMMLLNLCKHFHYPILLSSDSHGTGHIGNFDHAMELIRIAEFPEELILNRSSGEFLSWLEKWNTLQIK